MFDVITVPNESADRKPVNSRNRETVSGRRRYHGQDIGDAAKVARIGKRDENSQPTLEVLKQRLENLEKRMAKLKKYKRKLKRSRSNVDNFNNTPKGKIRNHNDLRALILLKRKKTDAKREYSSILASIEEIKIEIQKAEEQANKNQQAAIPNKAVKEVNAATEGKKISGNINKDAKKPSRIVFKEKGRKYLSNRPLQSAMEY